MEAEDELAEAARSLFNQWVAKYRGGEFETPMFRLDIAIKSWDRGKAVRDAEREVVKYTLESHARGSFWGLPLRDACCALLAARAEEGTP